MLSFPQQTVATKSLLSCHRVQERVQCYGGIDNGRWNGRVIAEGAVELYNLQVEDHAGVSSQYHAYLPTAVPGVLQLHQITSFRTPVNCKLRLIHISSIIVSTDPAPVASFS